MSICWDCEKKDACGTLYLNGEQQYCQEREDAYKSHENYVKWLAKSKEFGYVK